MVLFSAPFRGGGQTHHTDTWNRCQLQGLYLPRRACKERKNQWLFGLIPARMGLLREWQWRNGSALMSFHRPCSLELPLIPTLNRGIICRFGMFRVPIDCLFLVWLPEVVNLWQQGGCPLEPCTHPLSLSTLPHTRSFLACSSMNFSLTSASVHIPPHRDIYHRCRI